MFAGVSHDGAEDAWCLTALRMEEAALKGIPVSGGTADIYKCFDQVLRKLLYKLLKLGGFPERIVNAYIAFMENLVVHNMVAGSLGEEHKHLCGIPQGCPLSMMLIAYMLRPWICIMKVMEAIPRILADDILAMAIGNEHDAIL